MSELIKIITATDPNVRNRSLDAFCRNASRAQLLEECAALDRFRRENANLYEQVRALFFLYAIYRFHLPEKPGAPDHGLIPFDGYANLLKRRFAEAIDIFLAAHHPAETNLGPSDGVASALASAYHSLGFQTLANQVRHSVRSVRGNQWMFRTGHPADHPLRVDPRLYDRDANQSAMRGELFPLLRETTPVRMDLTHSGWSDIFFLGMDFPDGARELTVSSDLSVREPGSGRTPTPPIAPSFRIIDQP
ncbi:MAG: UTP--glucose-1-phosphate uridylyltransferase, partial [Chloroflexi bacterium]|nr:UTP--glucose-1-phosphate uridylyltransferase [Chloroflexota bacterium]